MKTLYTRWIAVMVLLSIQTIHAQFEIVPETQANGETEEGEGISVNCFCSFVSNFLDFERALAAYQAQQQQIWLEGQEDLLKSEIEDRLNNQTFNTFEEAQIAFFRSYTANHLARDIYHPKIQWIYEEETHFSPETRTKSKITETTLQARYSDVMNDIIDGSPPEHYFGDVRYQGEKITSFSHQELKQYRDQERSAYQAEQNVYAKRKKYEAQFAKAKEEDRFENYLAEQYIRHYRSLSYESRIRFMTRQLIAHNNPHRYVQVMQYDFGNSDTKFDIHDYEYTQELKDLLSSIPVDVDVPEYEIEVPEAIYQHTLLEHVGTRGASMINASTSLSKYTRGFLENTRSNNVALGMLTKFVGDYTEGREFVPPTEPLFSAENGEILINDRVLMNVGVYANIDTVIELVPGAIEIEFFEGIQDIMGELYTGGNRDFEGGVIRYFLENNDISIHPDITDWQLEQVFTINSVYNSQYDYDFMVDYVLPYGIEFAQNGASVRSLLSNPLQMRAAVEIMRGADYRIRELMSVLMLSDELDFSYEQEQALIKNKPQALALYHYYFEGNNGSIDAQYFVERAVEALRYGGTVDIVDEIILNSNVSDCIKEVIERLKLKDTHGSLTPDLEAGAMTHLTSFILGIFDENPYWSVEFFEKDLGVDDNYNERNGTTKKVPGINMINITLDEDIVNDGTQLFMAKTLIHETMHSLIAYVNYNSYGNDITAAIQALYEEYREVNSDLVAHILSQHEFMGQYVEAMAGSLAAYDSHKQPMDYYMKLSWGGLETSSAYQALSYDEKTEIQNIIRAERYGKSSALGEKCP